MGDRKRLSLVDGDHRSRAEISHLLTNNGFHVEPFEHIRELFDSPRNEAPLLIRDEGDAIPSVVDHMRRTGRWMPVVAFAQDANSRKIINAGHLGVGDYLVWPFCANEVAESIRFADRRTVAVLNGQQREVLAANRIKSLSKRERQVLLHIANGFSNREISERLSISRRTVECHRANMLDKLGVKHTSEAIRMAIESSLFAEHDSGIAESD